MIYLDNGATSFPKPHCVIRSVTDALTSATSPGRGSSGASRKAADILYELRKTAGNLFSCDMEQVVLTASATHGLNIAIKSLVSPGDRVVISGMEHNAVVRPLYAMGADIKIARGQLFDREALLCDFDRLLTKGTKACVMTHVSNVFGWVLPVEEVAEICRNRGIPFILDASQSAGTLPVSMEKLGAHFIAMPGHKGLLGPQGTGLLLCGHETKTILEGGTGSLSKEWAMPEFLPDRQEAGTQNIPGAAGLLAGMKCVMARGPDRILSHERKMGNMGMDLLNRLPEVRVFRGKEQCGLFSFVVEGKDPVLLAERLAQRRNIALRAGLHCAPVAHETAKTLETGTIRVSPGPFTEPSDLCRLFRGVKEEICGKM